MEEKKMWCGHGPWGGPGMMPGHMPGMSMGMGPMAGMGMRCPVCGEPLFKPTKEEMLEMLERKKKRLQAVIDHLNMEIEKLNASPQ